MECQVAATHYKRFFTCHQQICPRTTQIPPQVLVLLCWSSAIERTSVPMSGRRHSSFYHCPMRGRRRGFAQLDCTHVTLHFEFPDPFNSDHQHPVGASCHRGSISPSGSSRNSSLELPGTIFVLSRFLSLNLSATFTLD